MPANSRAHKQQKRAAGNAPMKRATPTEKGDAAPPKRPARKRTPRER
ncbi:MULTISPECIES: hypothetical protein [Burkholderia]|nr:MULTISPECIES: hypothetical protein [Burkholderia]EKS9794840.1 hypothetical protein [Burkholderia cepacia]EKS9802795.1 hypothetical protein [Burkholderia cepacia]EKS9809302.1 hypothetical protein [Burkholderia cepacia]EKS9818163.1 hypothetical protein [Burkholderia cepacia]EKS9824157.1 hypothetical protein [Burkholderia cepacia]